MLVGITGASGFIGSALAARHVQAGDTVRCLTRDSRKRLPAGVQPVEGDLTVPDHRLVRFCDGVAVLYHCAGEVRDEQRMQAVNVDGVRALLHAAAGRVGRWVQLSSTGVYGPHRAGLVSEETPLAPANLYERTKAAADALVAEAADRQLIASHAMLRPSIVFGPGMPNRSIQQLAHVIRRGLFVFVGSRGASANYVYISNVVDALMMCGTAAEADGRVYNLSDWCTVEEFVAALADALGRPRPRLRLPEPPVRWLARAASGLRGFPLTDSRVNALVNRSRYSIRRIQDELRYSLAVPIPAGLARLVAAGEAA